MPLTLFAVGFAFGWWAERLFFPVRLRPSADADEKMLSTRGRVAFSIALLLVVGLLAGHYFDWFCACYLGFEAFILSPGVLSLFWGGIFGFWASRYRAGIGEHAERLFGALLGAEKSSWALQTVAAIFALLALVLALKPDLLEKIESFKAGEFEAKFSTVSATTREVARVNLSEIRREVTIAQWIDFKKNFRGTSPRAKAVELFDKSAIKVHRRLISDILFDNYIEPLAIVLACVKNDDRLEEVRRTPELVKAVVTFRNELLYVTDSRLSRLNEERWAEILKLLSGRIAALSMIIKSEVPESVQKSCDKYAAEKEDPSETTILSVRRMTEESGWESRVADDSRDLHKHTTNALAALNESADERAYKLSFIDPYVSGAVGDLVALTLGNSEKANFLTRVKRFYPTELSLMQPGFINLYFQLADTKVQSEANWPFQETLNELGRAMRGANFFIAESERLRIQDKRAGKNPVDPDYDKIIGVYVRNKFIFTIAYLDAFTRRLLAGERVSDQDRHVWMGYHRLMEAVLNLEGFPVSLALDDIKAVSFRDREADDWKAAVNILLKAGPQFVFDARVSMAFSAIMLTEQRGKATTQACAVARFYLSKAKELVPDITTMFDLRDPETARLRGYLTQADTRVAASC